MITWNEDAMSTGVALIDVQHRTLFQKFDEFSQAVSENKSREAATAILDYLQFYAVWHFGQEEASMAEYNCAAAEKNKREHDEFRVTFGGFYEQWHTGSMNMDLALKTYEELEAWLVNHIMSTDVQLRQAVEKRGQQSQ